MDLYGKKAVKKWHKGVKKYADGLGPVIKDLQKILTYKNMELLGFDPKDHEKVCPDCFENIKLPAVICIYCKRKFSSDEVDVAIDKLFSELYDEPRYTED